MSIDVYSVFSKLTHCILKSNFFEPRVVEWLFQTLESSAFYKPEDLRHHRSVCNWCRKKEHWSKVCLSWLTSHLQANPTVIHTTQIKYNDVPSKTTAASNSSEKDSAQEVKLASLQDQLTGFIKIVLDFV